MGDTTVTTLPDVAGCYRVALDRGNSIAAPSFDRQIKRSMPSVISGWTPVTASGLYIETQNTFSKLIPNAVTVTFRMFCFTYQHFKGVTGKFFDGNTYSQHVGIIRKPSVTDIFLTVSFIARRGYGGR